MKESIFLIQANYRLGEGKETSDWRIYRGLFSEAGRVSRGRDSLIQEGRSWDTTAQSTGIKCDLLFKWWEVTLPP